MSFVVEGLLLLADLLAGTDGSDASVLLLTRVYAVFLPEPLSYVKKDYCFPYFAPKNRLRIFFGRKVIRVPMLAEFPV